LNDNIWIVLRNFCYFHDFWINHNFESERTKIIIMMKTIQFEWREMWTLDQIN
jgi:hypothetical protein